MLIKLHHNVLLCVCVFKVHFIKINHKCYNRHENFNIKMEDSCRNKFLRLIIMFVNSICRSCYYQIRNIGLIRKC